MKSMKIQMLAMSSLLLAAFAVAQSSGTFPFTGVITGNNVNVRSGPDTNWYAVAKLMQDNRVQVIGEDSGWYQIVPPQGTFSLVSQDYVDKSGNKGTITGDRVAIRAGSSLGDQDSAIQLLAGKGMEVTIIGQQGTWYKIVPPDGAYVWVAKQLVKPVDAAAKVQPTKEEPAAKGAEEAIAPPDEVEGGSITSEETPTTQKAVVAAETEKAAKPTIGGKLTTRPAVEPQIPGLVRTSKTTIRTGGPGGETKETTITSTTVKGDGKSMGEYGDKLYEIEKAFIEEMKKPLKDRNLAPLIAKLEPIANQKDNVAAATFAKNRIEAMKYQMDGQEGVTKLQEIQQEYVNSMSNVQMPAMKDYKESEISAAPFQGAGVLRPSLVFSGPLMPERYRLFDTAKNRTVAYVEIAPEVQIHISDYIGKNVAVYGTATVDEKLGYRVIQASFFKIVPEPESVTNSSSVIP